MTEPRPAVLVLDEELPIPPNTGKRIRTFNLLTRLCDRFEIHLVVHAGGTDDAAVGALTKAGIRVHVAPSRIPPKTGLAFAWRLGANLAFSRLPYSVASHRQEPYRRLVDRLFETEDFSLVHSEWTPYAVYIDTPPVPHVVAAHNVEARIWERLARNATRKPERTVFGIQAKRMELFERSVSSVWMP